MAKKYYLIPITNDRVNYNGTPLNELLSKMYPGIDELEKSRIDMLMSRSPFCKVTKEELDLYNDHIDAIRISLDAFEVPHYLIAVGTDKEACELITGVKITPASKTTLKTYETPKDIVTEYFDDIGYSYRIAAFNARYIDIIGNPLANDKPAQRKRTKKNNE